MPAESASGSMFRFLDETIDTAAYPIPQVLPGHAAHPVPDHPLVRALQSALYHRVYCHHHDEKPGPPRAVQPSPTTIEQLSRAHTSVERWDPGWHIHGLGTDGAVLVSRGDRSRHALAGEYITEAVTFQQPVIGAKVRIRAPRDSETIQLGFYFMFGETLGDLWDEQSTLRYYVNASHEATPLLVRYLSETLNRFQVPYRMKALTDPAAYTRADSTVLYTSRRYHSIVARILRDTPAEPAAALRDRAPLFSRPLRPGVGLAVDPSNGESFGMHRCRLVALATSDSDPAAPDVVRGSAGAVAVLTQVAHAFDRRDLMDAATRHGDALIAAAHRADSGWSWPLASAPALLGYPHGAAGVAVALLELSAASGDNRYLAAARHALRFERAHHDPERGTWPNLHATPTDPARFPIGLGRQAPLHVLRTERQRHGLPAEGRRALPTRGRDPDREVRCALPLHGRQHPRSRLLQDTPALGAGAWLRPEPVLRDQSQRGTARCPAARGGRRADGAARHRALQHRDPRAHEEGGPGHPERRLPQVRGRVWNPDPVLDPGRLPRRGPERVRAPRAGARKDRTPGAALHGARHRVPPLQPRRAS